MKYLKRELAVSVVNIISKENLDKLNKKFGTNYRQSSKEVLRFKDSFKDIKKLMEEKPKGGYYGI